MWYQLKISTANAPLVHRPLMSSLVCASATSSGGLPGSCLDSRMAELRAALTLSLSLALSCQPTGLLHGSEYASREKASCKKGL